MFGFQADFAGCCEFFCLFVSLWGPFLDAAAAADDDDDDDHDHLRVFYQKQVPFYW